MKSLVGITVLTALLSSCFNAPVTSNGKVSVINGEPRAAFAKAIAETKALSSFDPASKVETSIQPPSGALANSKITMPPGALNISADLVIEESVPMSETSVVSSLGMGAEITIVPIGAGIIIRPSQSVTLTKPLTIALSLGESSGLRAWLRSSFLMRSNVHYAVFYKSMIAGELRAGVIPTSSLRLTDNNQVQFEGYFGAYWLVEVSAPVEEKIEVPTTEPAVNINRISVIDNTGIVAEETIAAKADIPLVQWSAVSMSFNPELRTVSLSSSINADRTVNQCQVDLRSSIAASSGTNANTDSRLSHTEKITNKEAHPLVGRFRCQDDQGRLTLSAWSSELQIPKEPDPAVAGSITIDSGAAFTSSSKVTLAIAATAAQDMYITAVKDCTSGGTWEAYKSSKSWDLTESNGMASVYVKFRNPLAYESLCISDSIQHDSTPPLAPDSLVFGGSSSASATLSLAFKPGTDANFSTHEARLCTAADCTAGCGSTVQSASSPVSLTGVMGMTYYGCARSLDQAGNSSNWIASIGTIAIGATNPTPPSAITVPSFVNTTSVNVTYSSGSDFDFATHNVKACAMSDCSTGCLNVTQDLASPVTVSSLVPGNSYWICLQSVDQANNTSAYIASGNSVTIDAGMPTAPSSIAWAAAYSNNTTAALNWIDGSDANFSTHNVKACIDSGCSTACTSPTQDAASPGSLSGLITGNTYYACVQSVDLDGNTSAWFASANTSTIDTNFPTLATAITVPSYSTEASVVVTYTAGTDSNFSTHYVKACTSSDCMSGCLGAIQDVSSPVTVSSLANDTAYYICIKTVDLAANISPYVSSGNSVLIDTSSPTAPSSLGFGSSYSASTTLSLAFAVGTDTNFATHETRLCTAADCSTGCSSMVQSPSSPINLTGTAGTTYYGCARSLDLAGNASSWSASVGTVTIDNTAPGDPTAVSVPTASNSNFNISFTAGAELNHASFNIKACTSDCMVGCVGETSTASSPGTISSAALSHGNSYRGCVQAMDQAGNTSNWVPSSGLVIFDTMAPNGASNLSVPAYSSNSSVPVTFIVGSDSNMSSHNFKACTTNNCMTGCLATSQTPTSPAILNSLVNGTAYYACIQAVDLAGNTSSFSFTPATVTIDTIAPGNPSAVSVPAVSATSFPITFTAGAELYPAAFNIKACTSSNCSTGCIGATTTVSSPGTILNAALTPGTLYYGCVQGADLAGNNSAFVSSTATVLYDSFTVTYHGNVQSGGSVPTDASGYAPGATVTVLDNIGSLIRAGYSFVNWNTAADGSGMAYSPAQTFSITANTTLYAQWTFNCMNLAGGAYVMVPGDSNYGTSSFCVQKYEAKDVGGVATAVASGLPWVSINQTSAQAACSGLGTNYHLITNDEWMSLASDIANTASNWSGGSVGSGSMNQGHSDNSPISACAASTDDSYAYVQTDCTPLNSGTWSQKRTHTLSTGAVIWDVAGNVWDWTSYVIANINAKPYATADGSPQAAYRELSAIDNGFTAMTLHDLRPINAEKSFWSDSWNSTQGGGQYYAGSNGSGGALQRGAAWSNGSIAGVFSASLNSSPSVSASAIGFRCVWQP